MKPGNDGKVESELVHDLRRVKILEQHPVVFFSPNCCEGPNKLLPVAALPL